MRIDGQNTKKQKEVGQAMIYIAAAVPGLLISLGFAYLRLQHLSDLDDQGRTVHFRNRYSAIP